PAAPTFRAMRAGAAGIVLGSTWMLAFIAYPYMGSAKPVAVASGSNAGTAALFYFPLLRGLAGIDEARIVTWVAVTPFLLGVVAAAIALLVLALRRSDAKLIFLSLATLAFFVTHVASRFGLPEVVEVRRNASWFAMMVAVLLAACANELVRLLARAPQRLARIQLRPAYAAMLVLLVLWAWHVPVVSAREMRDKLLNYSGYGATAYAVLSIQRHVEPFSWTLVTYGQEYPMVLGRGFHLAAAEFLDRYDPAAAQLTVPTRYVFIAVEKNPHHFQINSWSERFTRVDLEQRLQTWCFLYQLNHRDMRVFQDDENVRVYVIERSDTEIERAIHRIAQGDLR
ncbi:MAG TPA: hypothetical protein VFN10_17415, partial [Thermoanaerobaculia bacterium]|nr:hypothetical protein [Thermoanaerobaculia bacterium]